MAACNKIADWVNNEWFLLFANHAVVYKNMSSTVRRSLQPIGPVEFLKWWPEPALWL